jgi:hypothetical protein
MIFFTTKLEGHEVFLFTAETPSLLLASSHFGRKK